MRPPRRRLTVSHLMIAVVAFALSIKLGTAYSRSGKYWEEARFYARASENARFLSDLLEKEKKSPAAPPVVAATGRTIAESAPGFDMRGADGREAAIRSREFADHLGRMSARYRRAAYLPWLPNAPEIP